LLALDSGLARWCSLSVGGVPPGAAPDFLFAQFTGGAGRWPSYGVIADCWPQPRQADGGLVRTLFIHLQRRRAPRRTQMVS
jgi:hypothetical protein